MDKVVVKKSKRMPSSVKGPDLSLALRGQKAQEGILPLSTADSAKPRFPQLEDGDGGACLVRSSGLSS